MSELAWTRPGLEYSDWLFWKLSFMKLSECILLDRMQKCRLSFRLRLQESLRFFGSFRQEYPDVNRLRRQDCYNPARVKHSIRPDCSGQFIPARVEFIYSITIRMGWSTPFLTNQNIRLFITITNFHKLSNQ